MDDPTREYGIAARRVEFIEPEEPEPRPGAGLVALALATVFAMVLLLLAGALVAPAYAQGYGPAPCEIPDILTIRDDGPGKAIVTYYNSVAECSEVLQRTLISPAGIEVKIYIDLLGIEDDGREKITLQPLDPTMMSFPPEGKLLDGEQRDFLIMGGMS
jgi:hypothetical protein